MLDLRQLRQFIAVAEELHFHRAAKRLHISQPPLTAAIRKLEEEIGAVLIERGNRTLGLTATGRAFLEEARATVRQAERALTVARDTAAGRTGTVRLGYVGSALYGRLPKMLRAFREQHPAVRLELREATSAHQVERLRAGLLDVGVLIPPVPDATDLRCEPFDEDRLAITLPRAHPLAAAPHLSVRDLADEPMVLWPAAEGRGFHLRVIRLCAQAGFVPRIVQEAHGMHGVLSLVAVEAGVSIVPWSMRGFRADEVVYRAIEGDDAAFELALCVREVVDDAAVRRFLDTATGPAA